MTITHSAPNRNPSRSNSITPKPVIHRRAVDVLRIALGFIFLWPFLDKLFGLGYSTPSAKAWIHGGSPTKRFLGHVQTGPFQSAFRSIAGTWADWLFMLGLLGIGVALLAGVALRLTAVAGTVLLVLMWAAEWPMARFNSAGVTTSSTNPVLDDHLVFAVGLAVVATFGTASTWVWVSGGRNDRSSPSTTFFAESCARINRGRRDVRCRRGMPDVHTDLGRLPKSPARPDPEDSE